MALGIVMLTCWHLERYPYREADLEIASDSNQSHKRTDRSSWNKTHRNDKYFELKVENR